MHTGYRSLWNGRSLSLFIFFLPSLDAARHLRYGNQQSGSVGMRYHVIQRSRINQHIFSIEGKGEAIQAARSRAIQVFAVNMVMRTVAGTLEAETIVAE